MEREAPASEILLATPTGDLSPRQPQQEQQQHWQQQQEQGQEKVRRWGRHQQAQLEERRDAAFAHEDVVRLLQVGTAGEVLERAEKARVALKGQKAQLARHAFEALQIIEQGGYRPQPEHDFIDLKDQVCEAVAGSLHYSAAEWLPGAGKPREGYETAIEVDNCTTLAALQVLAAAVAEGEPFPGALNFASARNPGGGFTTGAQAQEESLARSSAIYPCLTRYFESFFTPSRRAPSGAYTHDAIFSPGVPVFREDAGALLEQPYRVDFVTAAAPNAGVMKRNQKKGGDAANDVLRERVPRVLDIFARHGVVDLVLGAWGCGVFQNDPAVVARIFHEELRGRFRGQFRRIIFAVLDTSMAEVFAAEFGTELAPPSSEGSKAGVKASKAMGAAPEPAAPAPEGPKAGGRPSKAGGKLRKSRAWDKHEGGEQDA